MSFPRFEVLIRRRRALELKSQLRIKALRKVLEDKTKDELVDIIVELSDIDKSLLIWQR